MKKRMFQLLAALCALLMLAGCGDKLPDAELTILPTDGTATDCTEWSMSLVVDEENGPYVVCRIENQGEGALIVWVDQEERLTVERGQTGDLVLETVGRAEHRLKATGYPNGHQVSLHYEITQQTELN